MPGPVDVPGRSKRRRPSRVWRLATPQGTSIYAAKAPESRGARMRVEGHSYGSFEHRVGAQQDRLGNRHAEGLGSFHTDHQFEPGWLLDGKLCGLGAVEQLVDVHRRLTKHLGEARSVRHQATRVDELTRSCHR